MRINWRALGLTQEQREQMQQLRRTFQVDTAGIRKELQFLRQDLGLEMAKDPVDRAKIDSVLRESAQLKQRLSEAATRNLLAIKGLLTPEQREKLADFQQQLPAELRAVRLDPDQRSQIQELIKNSRQANKDLFEELRELKEDLRVLLLSPDGIEMEQLEQLQAQIAEKEFALEKARVENLLEIRDVLTPEQRERLKKSRSNRQKTLPKKRK
jgi:Spy/CpxP family protein refolding chaperone